MNLEKLEELIEKEDHQRHGGHLRSDLLGASATFFHSAVYTPSFCA